MTAYHSEVLAHAGTILVLPFTDLVCQDCGSSDVRKSPRQQEPFCATCGSFKEPIMRSIKVARELRGED